MTTRRNTKAFKPKVFIASSKEHVTVARAVQRNFHTEFETKIWDQNAFKLSTYPLESLLKELEASHFGVFVATPDDFVQSRGKAYRVPRDNVIFELGMFVGRLGRQRAFVVVPAPITQLKLPSDLGALTLAVYDPVRSDRELVPALGPACDEIRQAIQRYGESVVQEVARVKRVGLFSELGGQFEQLLGKTKSLTVCFIHSRRWRENHNDRIIKFLQKEGQCVHGVSPESR
jgi:predicted nucleotide-binding protein